MKKIWKDNRPAVKADPFSKVSTFQPGFAFHVETSHLISTADEMTGFHMKSNIGQK